MDEIVDDIEEFAPTSAEDLREMAQLRFLRRLVTVLTAVMIGGLLVLIVLFVIRFPVMRSNSAPGALVLPSSIALPEGAKAEAITMGSDWIGVVTKDDRILIYDRASGALRQEIAVER
ncbi:MAG: hypothetical protein ACJA2X_000116 [Halocynthiibacter sp.]|jgi:hypothetical protein